jgi:DNA primase
LCERFELRYCHKGEFVYVDPYGRPTAQSYDSRVIIPIRELDGTMVSFQGRDTTGEQLPKYLFPNGFAVAGKHLYNGHSFQQGLHTHAVVGEGAFDAIAIHQALIKEAGCADMIALATFGMHLSGGEDSQLEKFIELREKGLRTVTLMWDGEARAMKMAVQAGLLLMKSGLQVRIATLPEGYDPAQGPDGTVTPDRMVRDAIFKARPLTTLNAVRIMTETMGMSKSDSLQSLMTD